GAGPGERRAVPHRQVQLRGRGHARAAARVDRPDRGGAGTLSRGGGGAGRRAPRHALPRGRLDGAPAGAPPSGQPHERVRAFQAGPHGRQPHHQDVRRGELGRPPGFAGYSARGVAGPPRRAAPALGGPPGLHGRRAVAPHAAPPRAGRHGAGGDAGAVCVARRPSHGAPGGAARAAEV
ncbi:MAG: Putative metal-dependent hydrolase YfiT, partial [uncultured Gemmatimonadetes bacterium]